MVHRPLERQDVPDREYSGSDFLQTIKIFPIGKISLHKPIDVDNVTAREYCKGIGPVALTPEQIGNTVRQTRKQIGVTQADLALTSGTGLRFVIDLEKGKPTCQLGKVLTVLQTLGIRIEIIPPRTTAGR